MNFKNLLIKSKKEVFSQRNGVFKSQNIGDGFDFAELREYDYQSDAKKINWMAFAKTRELYQKEYNPELSRNITVLPIFTGSLFFGYERLLKDMVLEIAALLSYSALLSKDFLNSGYIKGEELFIKYLNSNCEIDKIIEKMSDLDIKGAKFFFDFNKLFYKLIEKNLIILIGDFLYQADLTLLSKKHEVVCIVVRNRLKEEKAYLQLKDNITFKEKNFLLNKKGIDFYEKRVENLLYENYANFKKEGIDFIEIYENENIFRKLSLFFGNR